MQSILRALILDEALAKRLLIGQETQFKRFLVETSLKDSSVQILDGFSPKPTKINQKPAVLVTWQETPSLLLWWNPPTTTMLGMLSSFLEFRTKKFMTKQRRKHLILQLEIFRRERIMGPTTTWVPMSCSIPWVPNLLLLRKSP